MPVKTLQWLTMVSLLLGPQVTFAQDQPLPRDDAVAVFRAAMYHCERAPTRQEAEVLQKWVTKHPNDPEASYWLAQAYRKSLIFRPADFNLLQMIQKSAADGFPLAQADIGKRYILGEGVPRDVVKGLALVNIAAEKGEPYAYLTLGSLYLKSSAWEFKPDPQKAMEYLQKALDLGLVRALHQIAIAQAEGGDMAKGFATLSKAAGLNDTQAEMMLANWYRQGLGVPSDPQAAFHWMKKAAEDGLSDAQTALGDFYLNGIGTMPNPAEALRWYSAAAEQLDEEGRLGLAKIYLNGLAGSIDFEKGRRLVLAVASEGNAKAQLLAGQGYLEGLWLPRDLSKAKEMFTRAVEGGEKDALVYLKQITVSEASATSTTLP